MEKTKVLLDTDIGSDIDDALCLSYLLSQPLCEIVGITTVTGQPERRAELAHTICMAAGKSLPIFPGAAEPIRGIQLQPLAQLTTDLELSRFSNNFSLNETIHFLYKTIRNNPGEITLLSIGPLTNVALLFTLYPDTPKLLKQLVMMCGIFHYKLPGLEKLPSEWNASVDPVATSIVYNTEVPIHRSVGLDVTCQLIMSKEMALEHFDSEIMSPILPLLNKFTYHDNITFHDPLAAVSLFDDTICTFSTGRVTIGDTSEDNPGKTTWTSGKAPHEVATEVNSDAFFAHFFNTLGCSSPAFSYN